MTITEFLEARIAEDEAAARAALDPDRPGTHWQWVTTKTDTPVPPRDIEEALGHQPLSLRSVEEYGYPEYPTWGPMPAFAIEEVNEMIPGVGAHIVRHDPARVLAECAAKRAIVELCARHLYGELGVPKIKDSEWMRWGDPILFALAAVYADHPDYQQEWRI